MCSAHAINCERDFKSFARHIRKLCLLKKCENKGISMVNCLTPYKLLPDTSKIAPSDPNGNKLLEKLNTLFDDSTKMIV